MTIMKRLSAATIALAALASVPAAAAPVVYNLSGTFTNGSSLTGSFSFDGTQTGAAQFSDVSVVVPGYFAWDRVYGNNVGVLAATNEYVYFYAGLTSDYIRLVFPIVTTNGVTAISGTQLTSGYTFYNRTAIYLTSGTITAAPQAAAVPEPATWGMMILGFGAVGGAMRYRRRATKISFA